MADSTLPGSYPFALTNVMNRRAFLTHAALASAAGWAALATGCSTTGNGSRKPQYSISLAEWSLHKTILNEQKLTNLDFPKVARREFEIDGVEYVNQMFMDKAQDTNYLRELQRVCAGEGVRSLLIMCDGEGNLGDADSAKRRQAVTNHHKWADAAKFLGCHSIRVNAAGLGAPAEVSKRAADSLHRLALLADPYSIDVIVENHGGNSSNGAWLAATIRAADHARVGTLPDFGNFRISAGEEYDRYQGVTELMPFARGVSAKSHDFDAEGNETHTDYARMLRIVLEAGYSGYVGIEYEGDGVSEKEGIRLTKALLERVRAQWKPDER